MYTFPQKQGHILYAAQYAGIALLYISFDLIVTHFKHIVRKSGVNINLSNIHTIYIYLYNE